MFTILLWYNLPWLHKLMTIRKKRTNISTMSADAHLVTRNEHAWWWLLIFICILQHWEWYSGGFSILIPVVDRTPRRLYPRIIVHYVHSLWPSGDIRRIRPVTTQAEVLAYCLTAPSHYVNQCRLSFRGVLWNSPLNEWPNFLISVEIIPLKLLHIPNGPMC